MKHLKTLTALALSIVATQSAAARSLVDSKVAVFTREDEGSWNTIALVFQNNKFEIYDCGDVDKPAGDLIEYFQKHCSTSTPLEGVQRRYYTGVNNNGFRYYSGSVHGETKFKGYIASISLIVTYSEDVPGAVNSTYAILAQQAGNLPRTESQRTTWLKFGESQTQLPEFTHTVTDLDK